MWQNIPGVSLKRTETPWHQTDRGGRTWKQQRPSVQGVTATASWPSPGRGSRSASCWSWGGTCRRRCCRCSAAWARSAPPPCWGRWPAPCRWRPSPRPAPAPRRRPRTAAAAAAAAVPAGTGNPAATGSWHPLSTVLQRVSLLPHEWCPLAAQ